MQSTPLDGTEVVSCYELRAICRNDVEDHVRQIVIGAAAVCSQ
jgi:hypothetical protein